MENKMLLAYKVAVLSLKTIGEHPKKVQEGLPGYFLDVENIFGYTDKDPFGWYVFSSATFSDLEPEDQIAIGDILKEFPESGFDQKAKDLCVRCLQLAEFFSQKEVIPVVGTLEGLGALAD